MARRSINNEAEYDLALIEVEGFFDNEPENGSVEAAAFDEITQSISDYEDKFWPIERLGDNPEQGCSLRSRLTTDMGAVQRPSRITWARPGRRVSSSRLKAATKMLKDRQVDRKRPVLA